MGDLGDYWREHRCHQGNAKARYQERHLPDDLALLDTLPVTYEIKNRGEHYIITVHSRAIVDYWPSTGRWQKRKSHATGFGIRSLARYFRFALRHKKA